MSKTIYRIARLTITLATIWGNIIHTQAAESIRNTHAGTCSKQLKLSKSGTSRAWITVKPVNRRVIACQGTQLAGLYRQF